MPDAEFEYVVEATGSSTGLRTAVKLVRPRGTVILKSTVHDAVSIDVAPVVVNEITLVGSRCGRFSAALQLLEKHRLRLDEMISDRFPLSPAPAAFARAATPGALKVLLDTT
jgi:alcohol dehydrogenase